MNALRKLQKAWPWYTCVKSKTDDLYFTMLYVAVLSLVLSLINWTTSRKKKLLLTALWFIMFPETFSKLCQGFFAACPKSNAVVMLPETRE